MKQLETLLIVVAAILMWGEMELTKALGLIILTSIVMLDLHRVMRKLGG